MLSIYRGGKLQGGPLSLEFRYSRYHMAYTIYAFYSNAMGSVSIFLKIRHHYLKV